MKRKKGAFFVQRSIRIETGARIKRKTYYGKLLRGEETKKVHNPLRETLAMCALEYHTFCNQTLVQCL
jgi:hypothetical protein